VKISAVFIALLALAAWGNEKVFVVERESSSLAVIKGVFLDDRIENMHNTNHATVKFFKDDGYMITRDGYVIKFDPIKNTKIAEYKTSKSAIGFVVEPHFVAVANYDNKTVEVLDRNLKSLQTITTDSKNVGIKTYKNFLIFALMDKDELWVYEDKNKGVGVPSFSLVKKFEGVGEVPFDAMIRDNMYIVGFFNSPWIGVVDLDLMSYKKVPMAKEDSKPVLKVPHFGFWSIGEQTIFIPSVGEASVMAYDANFKFLARIKTEGLPVFTALSPDKKHLAVTFSGDKFPFVQIIDTKSLAVIKTLHFEGSVLHVRWSDETPMLYVSVNTADEVQLIDTNLWEKRAAIPVKRPSGIFLYHPTSVKEKK
jgi:protein NirF